MKKVLLLLLATIGVAVGMSSQRRIEVPLWNNGDGVCNDSDAFRAELVGYLAQDPNGMAIISCPGGSYSRLAISHEGTGFADWMNNEGVSLFVLKYRLPDGRCMVPLADARQALKIVRSHAAEWGINPKKVGIMGSSAGGHLAATASTLLAATEDRPDFQVLLYPCISQDTVYNKRKGHYNLMGYKHDEKACQLLSADKQVTAQTPPAFIVLTADDKTVPPRDSYLYAWALSEKGVPHALHVYPKGKHGFGSKTTVPFYQLWTTELKAWLKDILQE